MRKSQNLSNHNVKLVDYEMVYEKLLQLGVETTEDLKYLKKTDLGFMKPIHIRKFLNSVNGKYKYIM